MATPRSFGRRFVSESAPGPARSPAEVTVQKKTIEFPDSQPKHLIPSIVSNDSSVDEELREWKRSRKSSFRIPWRQLSLMASLCFAIASFVLPDWVNGMVKWLLFALMAASFYAGVINRRESKG